MLIHGDDIVGEPSICQKLRNNTYWFSGNKRGVCLFFGLWTWIHKITVRMSPAHSHHGDINLRLWRKLLTYFQSNVESHCLVQNKLIMLLLFPSVTFYTTRTEKNGCTHCWIVWFCYLFSLKLPEMSTYSWIGRPVRTHKKSICREAKRATTNFNTYTDEKLSIRGASNGGVQQFIFSFWRDILKK